MSLKLARTFKQTVREICVEATMRTSLVTKILGRNIWSVYDYMFSPAQLIFLTQGLMETRDVPGCCVEIGCAYGRTTAFLRKFMDESGILKRYYAIDTFKGFVPEHLDYEASHRNKNRAVDLWFVNNKKKWFDFSLAVSDVRSVESIQCDAAQFDFSGIGPIAFALLDVDLYLPIAAILPKLYESMSPGGVISSMTACRMPTGTGRWRPMTNSSPNGVSSAGSCSTRSASYGRHDGSDIVGTGLVRTGHTGVKITGWRPHLLRVMAGLVPATHDFAPPAPPVVGGRAKPGHDTVAATASRAPLCWRQSGRARP